MSKTFTMTVGNESAKIEIPDSVTLSDLVDLMVNAGCKINPLTPIEEPEYEPWTDLGMSYSQWFRLHVRDW